MEKREWTTIKEYQDILFEFYNGIAKITMNRPRYRNAFTPTTTTEISDALYYCRECQDINVVVLTGAGDKAFCSGGDMNVKGRGGYVGTDGVPRLNVLDVQKQIRSLPKLKMGTACFYKSWIKRNAPPRLPRREKFRGTIKYAGVVELVDSVDLGSSGIAVQVRVLSPAPKRQLFEAVFSFCQNFLKYPKMALILGFRGVAK